MSPLRILIVTFEFLPFSGGIATYTHLVARGLAELGREVRVLAPRYPGCEAGDAQRSYQTVRMEVGHGKGELLRFLPGYRALANELGAFSPHVVLLTSDLAHGLGGVACARRGVPYVPVVHGSEVAKHFPPQTVKQRIQSLWLGSAYRKAAGVFCVSEYVRGLMLEGGFDPAGIRVIHNGVEEGILDQPVDSRRVEDLRRSLGVKGKRILLTLARLTPRKGQAEMIRAMPAILERHPDACYIIAGTGDDERRLRELVLKMGLERKVVFAGEIPEEVKLSLLDLCEVYVLPSRREGQRVEGLGIGLLEAGARGKPLVAGRHGGIGEIIQEGENGILLDASRPSELARGLTKVLDDPELASALGRSARKTVRAKFLAGRMARASLEAMEEILTP